MYAAHDSDATSTHSGPARSSAPEPWPGANSTTTRIPANATAMPPSRAGVSRSRPIIRASSSVIAGHDATIRLVMPAVVRAAPSFSVSW